MSYILNHLIPRIAALTGLPAERIGMAVDAARWQPAGRMPAPKPAPDVVDSVQRRRGGYDRTSVATALQHLLAALIQIRQQELVDVRTLDPLLTILAGRPLTGIAPATPVVAGAMRARLGMVLPDDPPPASLPVVLPDDQQEQERAVRAAISFAPWTDEEVRRIKDEPNLVGLAWAIGVDHPLIRDEVERSLEAAVAAIGAGATEPNLLARVEMDATLRSGHAASILIHRPDLATGGSVGHCRPPRPRHPRPPRGGRPESGGGGTSHRRPPRPRHP